MVIKPILAVITAGTKFESSVISYGNQTAQKRYNEKRKFESSVISYGNQTM